MSRDLSKAFNNAGQSVKIVLSAKSFDVDFSLSEFEEIFNTSESIIQSNRNTLKKVCLGEVETVVKSFKIPNAIQGFIYRYFRRSKARRSYEYSFLLSDSSVKTPEPLGYIEVYQGFRLRQSYFISSHLDYDFLIRDVLDNKVENKASLLKDFVAFTHHLHSNKILHLDYSAGNVCIKKVNDEYQFYLVDINRMAFGSVSTKAGMRNFSRISSEPKDIAIFSKEYAKFSNASFEVCQQEILNAVVKARRYRDRKRKFKQFLNQRKTIPASSYLWSDFSDQPYRIRDVGFKRKLYFLSLYSSLKVCVICLLLPLFSAVLAFNKILDFKSFLGFKKTRFLETKVDSLGLCVNIDNPMQGKRSPSNEQLVAMVDELGVKDLLVRIPLSDFENFDNYFRFIESFSDKTILVNILQDRHHVNDLSLAKVRMREIFRGLKGRVNSFQIGNSVNRRKWGFVSQDEYFDFFKVAQELKENEFNSISLLGGNIIDFELPYFLRSLFHCRPIFYNGVSAQLYVDRRGAPENKQFGFDTLSKINFYSLIMRASRKSDNKLYITEVNWPLKEMKEWAPAQGKCMVSESLQASYLVRYYLMMLASGKVEKCYWHQLVAPGYGLVNNLGGELLKRDAYYCYKFLIKIFAGGVTRGFSEKNKLFRLIVETDQANVQAVWTSVGDTTVNTMFNNTSNTMPDVMIDVEPGQSVVDMRGEPLLPNDDLKISVSGDVVYLVSPK